MAQILNDIIMKNVFLQLMIFTFSIGFAQDIEEDTMFSQILEKQIEALELTGEKKEAFEEISTSHFEKMMETRQGEGSKMSKFKQLKSLQEAKDKELKELLTEEEFSIYKDMQKENRKMLKERYRQKNKM